MNSSYPSFLSENSNRSFPFVENHLSTRIPNDCFIDFRCWTRFLINESPSLYLVAKGTPSVSSEYDQFFRDGFITLLFLIHRVPDGEEVFNGVISAYVPLENSDWPYLCSSSFWDLSGNKMFELKTVLNSSVLNLIEEENGYFFPRNEFSEENLLGLCVEPTQVIYTGGVVIDGLNILNEDGDIKTSINGNVKIQPGYNCSVTQELNNIILNSSINAGIGRRYSDQNTEICSGVFSINGVSPDDSGNFYITGENGIMVFSLPEDHKIVIAIDPKSKIAKCQT